MDENQIIFANNKYTRWYNLIVGNARQKAHSGYIEKHHIIPRSLGGVDTPGNIVNLTAREHFVCHLLLTKMTVGHHNELMKFAVGKFIQTAPGQQRKFTSWEYKKIRENISQARLGKKHSEQTRKKISENRKGKAPWNKGMSGIVHSEESNKKRSDTLRGRLISEEHKAKISASKLGKPSGMLGKQHPGKGITGRWTHSEETKEKLSKLKEGKKFSDKHLKNLSEINKKNGEKRKGIPQQKVECPHCHKIGGKSMMTRYHYTNCKNLK